MKNKLFYILLFIPAVTVLFSCTKKKWKLPTDVSFKMDITRAATLNGQLVFTGGTLIMTEFSFEGERVQGDDVYFEKEFPNGLTISFHPDNSISGLDFEIPQGTYERIWIEFEAEGDTERSIVIDGSYTTTGGTTYPLLLEIEAAEIYQVTAKDYTGGNEIILDKDIPASSLIRLDPIHWFGSVSTTMLDNSSLASVNGSMTILINDTINENILDVVVDRVDEKTEIIFE